MADKTLTFEEALERLESCADRISSKDATLEDAIAAYEEGAGYYEQCDLILKDAKQRIRRIGPGADDPASAGDGADRGEG
ncbi:MAG: exodeoxyribonuclease VII small subunit [Clostridiales Family XIII bacterium]|jgi:exodeoxyribonuclease VII small subunit|nr:exodeoxyribonuclease VII small subunit [Clostridiales Family XIII bacterium]